MHAKESPVLDLANRHAGTALRVVRETHVSTRPGAAKRPPSQEEFGRYACKVLGIEERSRQWWQQMESGELLVPAAMLITLASDGGMSLEEVLSIALHRMVGGEHQFLVEQQEEGRARRLADPRRQDRIGKLMQHMRSLRALKSRSANATEHPPIES